MKNMTSIVVTALGDQPEACASDLGDDQSHYLCVISKDTEQVIGQEIVLQYLLTLVGEFELFSSVLVEGAVVAWWAGHHTCDWVVVGSTPGPALLHNNRRQVVRTRQYNLVAAKGH